MNNDDGAQLNTSHGLGRIAHERAARAEALVASARGPAPARLLSIGTAQPAGRLTYELALELALGLRHPDANVALIRRLHERAEVRERRVAIIEPVGEGPTTAGAGHDGPGGLALFGPGGRANPSTAQRLAVYERAAPALAVRASQEALDRAGVLAGEVTHVVTASCTGARSPGLDRRLIDALGLRPGVRRTHVGFMGCHAAINALAVASALARADTGVVLVCCAEVCSVHMHHSSRPDRLVANALFADGAAAAVVAHAGRAPVLANAPLIVAAASSVIPSTEGLMAWDVGDHGFEMTLDASVPDVLAQHVPGWIASVLAAQGLSTTDIAGWAVHPGGPKVVRVLAAALGLAPGATECSLGVLADCGNMSSATVLFILQRLLGWADNRERASAPAATGPIVAAAFGPGLAGEMLLLNQA